MARDIPTLPTCAALPTNHPSSWLNNTAFQLGQDLSSEMSWIPLISTLDSVQMISREVSIPWQCQVCGICDIWGEEIQQSSPWDKFQGKLYRQGTRQANQEYSLPDVWLFLHLPQKAHHLLKVRNRKINKVGTYSQRECSEQSRPISRGWLVRQLPLCSIVTITAILGDVIHYEAIIPKKQRRAKIKGLSSVCGA